MARSMMMRTQEAECPSGIITHACANWNRNRQRQFYGWSHTAPTPREHTIQQLIPMAINPLGRMGQMMRHFLYNTGNPTPDDIPETHPMARSMMMRTRDAECPSRIITHACANWNRNRQHQFYGRSHTAPRPREHTIQQLGLVVAKAYGNHLGKRKREWGTIQTHPGDAKQQQRTYYKCSMHQEVVPK